MRDSAEVRAVSARSAVCARSARSPRGPARPRGPVSPPVELRRKWGPSRSSAHIYSHSSTSPGPAHRGGIRYAPVRRPAAVHALARGNRIMAQRARDVVLPARHVHAAWASSCFARSAWLRPSAGSRFAPHVLAVSNEAPRSWKVLRRGTSPAQYCIKVRRMLASLPRVSGVSAHCDIRAAPELA
jgi:hypothetical protein